MRRTVQESRSLQMLATYSSYIMPLSLHQGHLEELCNRMIEQNHGRSTIFQMVSNIESGIFGKSLGTWGVAISKTWCSSTTPCIQRDRCVSPVGAVEYDSHESGEKQDDDATKGKMQCWQSHQKLESIGLSQLSTVVPITYRIHVWYMYIYLHLP